MTENSKQFDIAAVAALGLWAAVGTVAIVLCGRAMAGAFDVPVGPGPPLLSTSLALLASLGAWTLFHRDQTRGDFARRIFDGFIALTPVGMIALATSANASAATLALAGSLLICGLGWVVGSEAIRPRSGTGITADGTRTVAVPPAADVDRAGKSQMPPTNGSGNGGTPQTHEHFERRSLPGGGEQIEAVLVARFLPEQRRAVLHLPIHPVLAHTPHVECEPLDESDVTLQVTDTYGYGVRVEVKRTADLDAEAAVPIGLLVTTADSGVSAA